MKSHLYLFIFFAVSSFCIAQSNSPFSPSGSDGEGFKTMREQTSDFDLSKIGGVGRVETPQMAEKIWKQFRSTNDFDGLSSFSPSDSGNCPDSSLSRHAFGHFVKLNNPVIRFVDLQTCPKLGCQRGKVQAELNGFSTIVACPMCEGHGKLGNVYNFRMIYSAPLLPLPAVNSDRQPNTSRPVSSPLSLFCSKHFYSPESPPMLNGSEVKLGRVDLELSAKGILFVMKIIDTSNATGGSGYYSVVRLMDSDLNIIAESYRVLLPNGGGVVKLPLASFSFRKGKSVGMDAGIQLALLNQSVGIRLEYDRFVGSEGLITTSTSIRKLKVAK